MMYLSQVSAIMVVLQSQEIVIGTEYRSPCKHFVNADLDALIGLSKSNKIIFGGDLNAKQQDWNYKLITWSSRLLSRHADRNQYTVSAPDSLTYYPNRQNANPDLLDIFLHHQELHVEDLGILGELTSDHDPVLLTVNSSSPGGMGRSTCHDLVRWYVFRQHLKPIKFLSDPFLPTDELETGIEAFTNTLRSEKITGQAHRSRESIKYFLDLSVIVSQKPLIFIHIVQTEVCSNTIFCLRR